MKIFGINRMHPIMTDAMAAIKTTAAAISFIILAAGWYSGFK